MSMIKCPECGKDMSDKAIACPNCGCPIDEIKAKISEIEKDKEIEERRKEEERKAKLVADKIRRQKKEEAKKGLTPEIKKKRLLIASLCAAAAVLVGGLGWYFGVKIPKMQAYSEYQTTVKAYNTTVSSYNQSINEYNDKAKAIILINKEYEKAINDAQRLVDSGDIPYEGEKITMLSNTLKDARNNKEKTPELKEVISETVIDERLAYASKTNIDKVINGLCAESSELKSKIEIIKNEAQDLVKPNYKKTMVAIAEESKELQDSYAIQKQITFPSEEWVIERLGRVENIANFSPVTEEHDPNGHLNKDGGYTATVYFSSPLLKTEFLKGDALINKGTEAGGAIEVYKTPEEAESRRKYLATFDGGMFATGSHTVLGTMVIRTSDELKASQQETLTNAIISAMVEID